MGMTKFDDIFAYFGDFGPYQRRQYFMLGMVIFSCGIQVMMTVFTLAQPLHRCAIPGLDNDTFRIQTKAHESLVRQYIPFDLHNRKFVFSKCFLYSDVTNLSAVANSILSRDTVGDFYDSLDANLSNADISHTKKNVSKCSRWVFDEADFSSTIVTQMGFVCDHDIKRSHATMTMMTGQVIGCLVLGPIADVVGRKKALMISLSLHLLVSVLTAWATDIYTLGALYLLNGLAMAAAYCVAFTLGMELIGPKWRHLTGVAATLFWSVGMLWLCLLAYFLRDWRNLQLAASCPIVLFATFFFLVPESARWLIRKGKTKEANMILFNAARMNGRTIPEHALLEHTADDSELKSESILTLLKYPALLARALIVFFNWAVCSLTYYGLGLNVGQLSGNIYLNFCLTALFEIAAVVAIIVAMGRFGRKHLYCGLLSLGSVSCALTLLPVLYGDESVRWAVAMLAMIGKFGVSGAFAIVWMFTSELFPTSFRASVTGVSSASARLGAVIASYIANLNVEADVGVILPQLVFGACGLIAAFLSFFLPETQEQQLPDSVDDALKFSRNKRIEHSAVKTDESASKLMSAGNTSTLENSTSC